LHSNLHPESKVWASADSAALHVKRVVLQFQHSDAQAVKFAILILLPECVPGYVLDMIGL